MDNNQPKTKKLSSTFVIFIACVLGLGIGLLTINYWHTSSCSSHTSADEIDEFIDAFKRRILQAESQV
jgi:flagellar basal body-associated protein FliL